MSKLAEHQKRRKRLPSQERREEFLSKAIEFFASEGFESSTRELARRLDVSQPLLYRYFPSKDDLIAEVYETVYVKRWRPEWEAMIADREQPLEERLVKFYHAYTEVVFQRDWMRIFLFAGLKGVDINRRYQDRVRERILIPILRECRHAAGLEDLTRSVAEVDAAWVMHGGIYYWGVRAVVYETAEMERLDFVIRTSLRSLLDSLPAHRG